MVREFAPSGASAAEISHPGYGRSEASPRKALSIQWLERLAHACDSGMDFASLAQHEPWRFRAPLKRDRRLTIRVSTEAGKTMTTIRIEGQLTSDGLPDVRAACESANPPIRLDLSGLRSADSDAIRALQALSEAGAELHGASPYINQLLLEANT